MKPHVAMDVGDTIYPACLWHTDAESSPEETLTTYVEQAMESSPLFQRLEADLKECRDCMGVYHEARERLIQRDLAYDQELFELEGRRLTETLSRDSDEQDILVPVTEVLWHPFLLFNPNLEAAFCRRLLELDETIGLEGFLTECIPTMYLLLIHPNKEVRDLAWQCLQQPEYHITCNNYEDISQVLHWVISAQMTGLATASARGQMPEVIRSPNQVKKLPAHLLCTASKAAYWQGVAQLLEIFNLEALKHGFMMSKDVKNLIPTLIDQISDNTPAGAEDGPSPFWPQLRCLTSLMDKLGSTMWQDVSKAQIENIFDIIKGQPVFTAAICDMSECNIGELPSSFETSVSPTEPFLWMTSYINSLLDFGKSASDNITGVNNFLCNNLMDLFGSKSDLSLDLLIAKFMRTLVKVLQSLLKTSLLCHLVGEIQTSMWLKTCLTFLQRYPPVRAQQVISVVVDVANSSRQFLIDVFKLAGKSKPNVGRSTQFIKMLGLPLQPSARAGSIFSPSSSQMKLWEIDMEGGEFDGCATFLEEALQEHPSAISVSSFSISRGRRDAARASASTTQLPFSHPKKSPHKSKLGGRLSATPKTTKDASARERNLFTDVEAGMSPKHASKPHEVEAVHPPATTSKLAAPVSTKSAKKKAASSPRMPSSAAPSTFQPGRTGKPNRSFQSSSDEILLISDVTSDEASSMSRMTAGGQTSSDEHVITCYMADTNERSSTNSQSDNSQEEDGITCYMSDTNDRSSTNSQSDNSQEEDGITCYMSDTNDRSSTNSQSDNSQEEDGITCYMSDTDDRSSTNSQSDNSQEEDGITCYMADTNDRSSTNSQSDNSQEEDGITCYMADNNKRSSSNSQSDNSQEEDGITCYMSDTNDRSSSNSQSDNSQNEDIISCTAEDIYGKVPVDLQSDNSQAGSADAFRDDIQHAQKAKWRPTVSIEVIPELEDVTESEGQFIITSEDPLRIRRAGQRRIKRELNSPTNSESSLTEVDVWGNKPKSSRRKQKKTKRFQRLRELESSSDESSSGASPGPSKTLQSTPPKILSTVWQASSSLSSSSPLSSPRKYPRDRLSRTRKLRKIKRMPTYSSDENEFRPEGAETHLLGVKKEPLPDDEAASSEEASQSLLLPTEVKEEGSQESNKKKIQECPGEGGTESSNLLPLSDDNDLDAPISVSDDSDFAPPEYVASDTDESMDWQAQTRTTEVTQMEVSEEVDKRKQSKEITGKNKSLFSVDQNHDYLEDALSPVSDDSDTLAEDSMTLKGDDVCKSKGAVVPIVEIQTSHQALKEEGSEKRKKQMRPSAEENTRSSNRPLLSDNQAMDYLEGSLSPVSDDSDSNDSSNSKSMLTQQVCKTEKVASGPTPIEFNCPTPELKRSIDKLVSAMRSDDSNSSDSSIPNVAQTSPLISSDESTRMSPNSPENSTTVPADQQQEDVKPEIHFVRFRRTSASLSNPQSSQGFSDSFSFTEDRQESEEVIDLDNYNCSELYDEDPLSQLIEISSDDDDVDLDQSEAQLKIDLDAPVKQEPEDDLHPPNQVMTGFQRIHSPSLLDDRDYLCALQDHEEATWFNDDEDDYHQDPEEEDAVAEKRPSGEGRMELEEEDIATKEPSSRSSSPLVDAAVASALQDQEDPVWFDDSPLDKEAEVEEAGEGSLQEEENKSKHETTFEEEMEDFTEMIAAAERALKATSQQKKRKTKDETRSPKKVRKISVRKLQSVPGASQSGGTKASTSAQSDAPAPVSSVSEPSSPLPKVQGSWKHSNFHQPEFTPTDAEPLKRFRGSNEDPELTDMYVLDSSQQKRKPRAANLEEDRHTATVQSWVNRFSSRTGSLFQTMKEGPPTAQKGHQGKAAVPPPKIRHSSGPPSVFKTGKSLDTSSSVTRTLSSYVETLPHYAQTVYAHATVTASSIPQIAGGQSSVLPADPSTLSSSGIDGGSRNDDANAPEQQTDSEPGSPVVDNVPLVSQLRFQFFTSDPQTAQTAASLPSLVNNGLVSNSSAAATTEQGQTSTSTNKSLRTPTEAPPANSGPPPQRNVSQPGRSSRGEASNSKPKEATTGPAVSLQPRAAVQLPKTASFSEIDLFYWVIGWNSQWLDIYGPPAEGQPPTSVPQAILADCPYKRLLDVPFAFDSLEDYYRVFVPLLLHEIWAQIHNNSDVKKPSLTAAFVECKHKEQRPTGFLLNCSFRVPASDGACPISPNDVIKVSPSDSAACGWCPLLAVVTGVNPVVPKVTGARNLTNHNAQTNGLNGHQATEKLFEVSLLILAKNEETYRALSSSIGHKVQLKVLHSLVSAARQFQGLTSFHKCGLLASDILRFRRIDVFCPPPPSAAWNAKPQDKSLNPCQLQAVSVASMAVALPDTLPRICLVNGPPGTGKTKTVIGLVKKILEGHKAKQHQQRLPGERSGNSTAKPPPIMLCAPSNPSINVLLRRLTGEIPTTFLHQAQPSNRGASRRYHVVRVCGQSDLVHPSVKKFSLDSQVQAKRDQESEKILLNKNLKTERREKLQERITELGTACGRHNLDGDLKQLRKAKEEKDRLIKDLKMVNARLEDLRRQKNEVDNRPNSHYEQVILESADIVCCTVNGSGNELLQGTGAGGGARDGTRDGIRRKMKFSCVIVDEANQCTELDSIIPLQNCSMKVVLVGDSQLIPASVASKEAHQHGLHRSLFERLCTWFQSGRTNSPPILPLERQHRMHTDIAAFPSKHFYKGNLQSDKNMAKRRLSFFLYPYLVFNVVQSKELRISSRSFTNEAEVKMVLALYRRICNEKMIDNVMLSEPLSIGIIAPYKDQASYLNLCLKKAEKELTASSPEKFKLPHVEISTMDQFQGREMEVVIVTCVRTQASSYCLGSSCGLPSNFLNDRKKMNFILTRARYCLYIVANLSSLQNSKDWGALAADAERRRRVIHVPVNDFKRAAARCKKVPGHPPPGKAQSNRAAAQEPQSLAQTSSGSPKQTVEGGLAPGSGSTGSRSTGLPSKAKHKSSSLSKQGSQNNGFTERTEVPQVPGLTPAINSHRSAKAKKTTSSSQKKVTFQEALDKGSSRSGASLLPKPMQRNPDIQSQGKQQNPYRLAIRSPPKSPGTRRSPKLSPKLPHYRQILKKHLFMAGGSPHRHPGRSSPARIRENKLTQSRVQGLSSTSARLPRTQEASLGSPSTSLSAQAGPVPDPLSSVHAGPGYVRLATTPTKNHLPVRMANQSQKEPGHISGDRTSVGMTNSRQEGIPVLRESGVHPAQHDVHSKLVEDPQPASLAETRSPAKGLPVQQPNRNLTGTSSAEQLQITIENLKSRVGKEKRTMPLSGLQPDPKLARRRRRWGSGATAPTATAPTATALDAEPGNSNGSDGPTRIPYLPSSDSD
ncbi:uncharacterized protein LOC119722737 isoform X3 [Patiria miniata]|uniref:Uncharacterized protein n=1 Tax=Patiria miniata TaxID=46514 RepID=A0A913ZB06_PATMI|nr:uncharacterized protein LOC119722737 isoform X3 [Patiria miniata]